MTTSGDPAVVLDAQGIGKAFGATAALRDARLTLRAGEVHALLGENGAGKSTLIKVLVGAHRRDRGRIVFQGEPLEPAGVGDAVARGIVPVYQQLTVMPQLTVRENLVAFELAAGRGWRRARASARDADVRPGLELVGLDVELDTLVSELSLAERQLLEIARAVVRDCRVLILDEPTTTLSHGEVEHLFAVVRRICERGGAVLFISHRLPEVAELAHRITVLRNGETVVDGVPAGELSRAMIVEAMAGEPVELPELAGTVAGEVVLGAEGLRVAGAPGAVDLTVSRGEIVGLVGLVGSGAVATAEAIAGLRPVAGGRITLAGEPLPAGDRVGALRAGIGLIPGDRDAEGVFPALSVLENGSASVLRQIAPRTILRTRAERACVVPRLKALSVRPDDPGAPIGGLSGGNQQKVLVARSLAMANRRMLVAIEPTRGVDVAARHDIHEAIVATAADGAGVLLASTDLEEIVAVCHRIVVMRGGAVAAELQPEAGVAAILAELTGAAA